MTAQHLMLIDLANLPNVRVECPKCGTAVSVSLRPDGHVARLESCVGCGADMGSVAERKAANELLQAIRAWQQQRSGLRLALELSPMQHMTQRSTAQPVH